MSPRIHFLTKRREGGPPLWRMWRWIWWVSPTLLALPAHASPWDAIQGNWRTTEIASCGMDDVRAGRILSMGENSIRYGFLLCVIRDGAGDGEAVTVNADCDLGGGYETPLTYEWTLTGPNAATMHVNGYDTQLIRCEKGIE